MEYLVASGSYNLRLTPYIQLENKKNLLKNSDDSSEGKIDTISSIVQYLKSAGGHTRVQKLFQLLEAKPKLSLTEEPLEQKIKLQVT